MAQCEGGETSAERKGEVSGSAQPCRQLAPCVSCEDRGHSHNCNGHGFKLAQASIKIERTMFEDSNFRVPSLVLKLSGLR